MTTIPIPVAAVEAAAEALRFIQNGRTEVGPNERPPFGCCLLIWAVTP